MKLVSIIIPCYNAEKYIKETIESVLCQSYNNWELIVVNDGSTDKSEEIIKPFLSDNRIRYINKLNEGVSITRNKGIVLANGEYLAFLDADDIWYSDNLKVKIEFLESNESIDWVFSNMGAIDEFNKRLQDPPCGSNGNFLEKILLWETEVIPGPCSNLVIRKKCIERGISFNSQFSTAADQAFTLDLAAQFQGFLINQVLWDYRILPNSMSRNIQNMEKDHINVYKYAKSKNYFKSLHFRLKCYSNLYYTLAGSYFVYEKNYSRAIKFIFLSLIYNPFKIKLLINKL